MEVVPHWQGEGPQVTVSLACAAQVAATCPLSVMFILTEKVAKLICSCCCCPDCSPWYLGNGDVKLIHRKFHLNIRKAFFFTVSMSKCRIRLPNLTFQCLWGSLSLEVFNRIRLPRELVMSPALEVFKIWLDMGLPTCSG